MSVTELLEQEKGQIMQSLAAAENAAQAQQVLSPVMDRLLIRYNEQCEQDRLRNSAACMIQTAKMSLGLMDSAGEMTVWENPSSDMEKKKMPVLSWVMSIIGVICMAVSLIMALTRTGSGALEGTLMIIPVIILAMGCCVALFFAGYVKGSPAGHTLKRGGTGSKNRQDPYLVVTKPDPEKCYRSLRAMTLVMDRSLQQTESMISGESRRALLEQKEAEGHDIASDDAQLDLISRLLEAKMSGDGQFALDRLEEIQYYLHRNGILAVELSDQTRQWFDFLPGVTTKTLRPALVKDQKVLRRGLASGG